MSYHVEYNPELGKRYPSVPKQRRKPSVAVILLLAVVIAAYAFFQNGLIRYLIPGDPEVTTAAFSTLVERIEEGESVRESLAGFCQEIILRGHK